MIYIFSTFRMKIKRLFSARRAMGIAGAAATIIGTGTVLFYLAEPVLPDGARNSLFNSLYYVVVTISTVGYGDIVPTNFYAKLVFFYIIIFGLGTFAAAVSEFGGYVAEKRLLSMRGLHFSKLKEHVVIVGYSEPARELIKRLSEKGVDYVLIANSSLSDQLKAEGINFISGDPLSSTTLKRAGIEKADVLVLSDDGDEMAVMVTLKAKEIKNDIRVVAACNRHEDYSIMKDAGIDIVLPVSKFQGDMLADAVMDSYSVDLLMGLVSGKGPLGLEEIAVSNETTIGNLSLPHGARAIAILSKGKYRLDFDTNTVLHPGDILFLLTAPVSA